MISSLPTLPKYTLYTQENPDIAKGTIGTIFDDKMKALCNTLELPWMDNTPNISCIPAGFYSCVKDNSGKFQYWRVEELSGQHVSGRYGIEFHNGNYLKETEGCILLGTGIGQVQADDGLQEYAVWSSRATIEKLKEILPDEFMLRIIRHRSHDFLGFVPTGNA